MFIMDIASPNFNAISNIFIFLEKRIEIIDGRLRSSGCSKNENNS